MAELTLPAPARCVKVLLALVPLPLLPPSFSRDDNARCMNANSSPTALVYTICRALKACTLSDWLFLAGPAGGKVGKGGGGNIDGNAGGGGRELNCALDWDGPPPPP